MPVPGGTPEKGDRKGWEQWIGRCISFRQGENPDEAQDQSVAICISEASEKSGINFQRGGKK